MKNGQVSMEVVFVVGMLLMLFTAVTEISLLLRGEAVERELVLQKDIRCRDLAAAIDGVYSSGPGASVEFVLAENATLEPGLIWLGTTGYGCDVGAGAFNKSMTLVPGSYTVVNRGGMVEFL